MTEQVNAGENNQEKLTAFTLRNATEADLPFLFKVSTEAMKPVHEALHPGEEFNEEQEFEKYKNKFDSNKIQIIQYQGKDAGRLRVERSPESIYVGGIQILPEFQNKGIGTAVFTELIEESKQSGVPIVLEVHEVNKNAINFYKKLGFKETGQKRNKVVMKFIPAK